MNSDIAINLLNRPSPQCFFILDIDSTLVTTWQRNQAILEAFVMGHQDLPSMDKEQLLKGQCQFGDYGIETCLTRINFNPESPQTLDQLMSFWRENFFSNNFLHADEPTQGAVEWVQQLKQQGIEFIFLTARHHSSMWTGTLSSMKNLGFPTTEANLFLKKDMNDSDEIYKSKQIDQLKKETPEKDFWLIDNEPVVLNQIAKDHQDVNLIWFESTHSNKMRPPRDVPSIQSFQF